MILYHRFLVYPTSKMFYLFLYRIRHIVSYIEIRHQIINGLYHYDPEVYTDRLKVDE